MLLGPTTPESGYSEGRDGGKGGEGGKNRTGDEEVGEGVGLWRSGQQLPRRDGEQAPGSGPRRSRRHRRRGCLRRGRGVRDLLLCSVLVFLGGGFRVREEGVFRFFFLLGETEEGQRKG
jgi:hypothetical protein